MRRLPRHLIIALQLAVSLGFVYGLLRRTDLESVGSHVANASLGLIGLSLVTKLGGFTLMSLRLRQFVSSSGALGFSEAFRAQSVAFVGNNVLPLRLGEALKIGFLARCGLSSITACVGIVAVERILDSLFLVLFVSAALLLFSDVIATTGALYLFMGISISAFVVLFTMARHPNFAVRVASRVTRILGESASTLVARHVAQLASGMRALASARLFVSLILMTAGYWIFSGLSVHLWILACGIEAPWYAAVVVLVFVSLATVLPSAPGFIGTYHYFAAMSLGLFGVSSDMAASFAIVGHAAAIIPFTLALSPLVAKDVLSLHRTVPIRVVDATDRLRSSIGTPDSMSVGDRTEDGVPLA